MHCAPWHSKEGYQVLNFIVMQRCTDLSDRHVSTPESAFFLVDIRGPSVLGVLLRMDKKVLNECRINQSTCFPGRVFRGKP